LSCRVIGRGVEAALVAHLAEQALLRQKARLEGWFLPTEKNAPAKEFYSSHGFEQVREEPEGSLWVLDLDTKTAVWPDWIARGTQEEVMA